MAAAYLQHSDEMNDDPALARPPPAAQDVLNVRINL